MGQGHAAGPQILERSRGNPEVGVMSPSEWPTLMKRLRLSFRSGKTRDLRWRKEQLRALITLCNDHEDALARALFEDLRKPRQEAFVTDIQVNVAEARYALNHLDDWVSSFKASVPLALQPASAELRYEPYGVALIIGAWNYPIQLVLQPLVAALAAGNCAVLKPSEMAPASSAIVARLVPDYLDTDAVAVVQGGVPETTALLDLAFDKIFYTGSARVARSVMRAAAKHLTPVSLELGGKSPAIADGTGNLRTIGRRIAWGRFINAGQTCVAPDYLLVKREAKTELVEAIRRALVEFYGEDPQKSPDYGRIINRHHWVRLSSMLEGQTLILGGDSDADELYLAPTLVDEPAEDSPVMQEEIFGPILPVLSYETLDEALAFVGAREHPLALYVFGKGRKAIERVIDETRSGGVLINDSVVHLGVLDLPFGGIGSSGMGSYHGHHGFEAFSAKRAVMSRPACIDPPLRYPPYSDTKLRWLKRLL